MYNEAKTENAKYNEGLANEPTTTSPSEFKQLLDRLENETNHSLDLSNEIFRYANTLKPIFQPDKSPEVELNPQGIIEMFQSEVWKLAKSNEKLVIVCNHLRELIGS